MPANKQTKTFKATLEEINVENLSRDIIDNSFDISGNITNNHYLIEKMIDNIFIEFEIILPCILTDIHIIYTCNQSVLFHCYNKNTEDYIKNTYLNNIEKICVFI